MGNAPSHEGIEGHRRLLKPRTLIHTPFPPSRTSLGVTRSEVDLDNLDNVSRQKAREELRSRIFGSAEHDLSVDESEDTLSELADTVRERLTLSRSCSVLSTTRSSMQASSPGSIGPNTSQTSLNSEPGPVDMDTTVSLLRELSKSASPEDLVALYQALQPSNVEPTSKIPVNKGLMRRRSMTPAVMSSRNPKRSLPIQTQDVQSALRSRVLDLSMEVFGASPLARVAELELGKESWGEPQRPPISRTTTPHDKNYLGALRPGTLTITNGVASPAASLRSNPIEEMDVSPAAGYHQGDASKANRPLPVGKEDPKTDPCRLLEPSMSEVSISSASSNDTRTTIRPHNASQSRINSPLQQASKTSARSHITQEGDSRAGDSQRIAQEYTCDLPDSPFGDDQSFRNDALCMFQGTLFSEHPETDLSLCTTSKVDPLGSDGAQHQRPPPVNKQDSGYSSANSVNGVLSCVSTTDELDRGRTRAFTASSQDSAVGSLASTSGSLSSRTSESSKHKPLPALPNTSSPNDRDLRVNAVQTKPSMLFLEQPNTAGLIDKRSNSDPSPVSPPSSARSLPAVETSASRQKKLQKQRGRPRSPLCIQGYHPVQQGSIPDVPKPISRSFTRRLSDQPEMEYLDRTYRSVNHTDADSESDGVSTFNVQIRFPSPSRPKDVTAKPSQDSTSAKHTSHRRSSTEVRPPNFRRSSSFLRFLSRHRESTEELPVQGIQDFGTVAQSLGKSPYDVAFASPGSGASSRSNQILSPTSTSHFNASSSRSRAFVGMDEATATDLARRKSQARQAAEAQREAQREGSVARHRILSRPKSLHFGPESRRAEMYSSVPPPLPSAPVRREDQPLPALPRPQRQESWFQDHSQSSESVAVETDWAEHKRAWARRRKSVGEGLRRRHVDHQGHWGMRSNYYPEPKSAGMPPSYTSTQTEWRRAYPSS